MKKVNLLSRDEMRKVLGGYELPGGDFQEPTGDGGEDGCGMFCRYAGGDSKCNPRATASNSTCPTGGTLMACAC